MAVTAPVSTADVGAICARVEPALPEQVDNTPRRDTTPRTDRTAAWGDPPVVMRCGVERPTALRATSQLNTVNGIDWLVEERDGGHVFTTVGRAAYVEVTVPAGHDPQVGPLVDLAPAMQFVPPRPEFYPPPAATPKQTATPRQTATPKR
ncbi:DUF3515 domain-containing protein [Sporichthya sp.]|uniref:DUF3515 domain-containing protein n=1 Tax=Sporichthya sp. TaxID=65475 RepID=UPI0025FBE9A5|nr:DUF3515 domain-containing protein [Sporichthya sp.]